MKDTLVITDEFLGMDKVHDNTMKESFIGLELDELKDCKSDELLHDMNSEIKKKFDEDYKQVLEDAIWQDQEDDARAKVDPLFRIQRERTKRLNNMVQKRRRERKNKKWWNT